MNQTTREINLCAVKLNMATKCPQPHGTGNESEKEKL